MVSLLSRSTPLSRRTVCTGLGCAASAWTKNALGQSPVFISTTLLDGQPFSTERIKGKVLLVNFWATWCGPCRAEMPEIDAYYRQHREQGLEVLAMSVDDLGSEVKVREVVKPFVFPVAMMKSSRLSGFGPVWRLPVSAVLDREGRLVKKDWSAEPKLDAATLDAVIKPLL